MGLKMKNVNIMGVHQFLGERGHRKTIYLRNCLKTGSLTIFRALGKKIGWRVFLRQVDTSMHTMT